MSDSSTFFASAHPRRAAIGSPPPGLSINAVRRWKRPKQQDDTLPSNAATRMASQQWWHAARARTRASIARSPSGAMRFARRWSPGIMPPLLGSLLLLAAFALTTHALPHQQPLVAPQTLLKLFVTYLVAGTLYGFVLYFAASDLVWMCLLALGAPVYLVLTLAILWGPVVAGIATAACVALAVRYVRRYTYTVPEGHIAITTLVGGYARTLGQGSRVLVPGERVAAGLDLSERRYTCPPHRTDIPNELGEVYQARASATVSYRLIPAEAHNAVLASDQWEADLHEQIGESLTQALGEWGAHLLMGDGTPPSQLLAKTLLRELREQVRPRGIHVGWVSVRDIWLAPEGELLPADDLPEALPATSASSMLTDDAPIPLAALRQGGDVSDEYPAYAARGRQVPVRTHDEAVAEVDTVLSADVLSDAYDAVREGRITDPETVRQIANAFLKVAADEELSAAFPYDAVAAAHILQDRAKSLERARR